MNLRIADPSGLVAVLHDVLSAHGELRLAVAGWRVVALQGGFFYAASQGVEVGGPYATPGALIRDAGRRRHAEFAHPGDPEPAWEVVEWGGAFFTVRAADLDAPSRHDTLAGAVAQGREGGAA